MKRIRITMLIGIFIIIYGNIQAQEHIYYLADDFTAYHKSSENLSGELKIRNFKNEVYHKAPQVYESIFNDIKWIGRNPDDRILSAVNDFNMIKTRYLELSENLDSQFHSSLSTFKKEFPDFNPDFDVYILHSLGIRAGGPVTIHEKTVLMFGVDQMAKYFDFQNFRPFFHHELTHILHFNYYTPADTGKFSKDALYNYLWTEGMAVYVSKILNPGASEKEIFMCDSLSQNTNKVLTTITAEIASNLYSTDKELIGKYFWKSSKDTIIPKTAGYYIGYILVKELAEKYSPEELIKCKEDVFIPEFERILSNFNPL